VRMWVAVRNVLLCGWLLSIRQSFTELASPPVFYCFFYVFALQEFFIL